MASSRVVEREQVKMWLSAFSTNLWDTACSTGSSRQLTLKTSMLQLALEHIEYLDRIDMQYWYPTVRLQFK